MHFTSITAITFIAVSVLALCLAMLFHSWWFRYQDAVARRLQEMSRKSSDPSILLFNEC
jgi:hypothetical protein